MTTLIAVFGLYYDKQLMFEIEETRPELIRAAAKRRWHQEVGYGIHATIKEIKWKTEAGRSSVSAVGIGGRLVGTGAARKKGSLSGLGSILARRRAKKTTPPSGGSEHSVETGD